MLSTTLRIVFFGRPCLLSTTPLAALIEERYHVVGIVTPSPAPSPLRPVRVRTPRPLLFGRHGDLLSTISSAQHIPLIEIAGTRRPEVQQVLSELQPELLVVSCFPWRLPARIVSLAPLGGINAHPSLLPRHRGPDPIFWTYRAGDRRTGVSIHRLSPRLDAGEIVASDAMDLPPGLPGDELERRLADQIARLLPSAVAAVRSRRPGLPQDESRASYESFPRAGDLEIERSWSAEHAWSFSNGVIPLGYRPTITSGGRRIEVLEAVELMPGLPEPEDTLRQSVLEASFEDGRVRFAIEV